MIYNTLFLFNSNKSDIFKNRFQKDSKTFVDVNYFNIFKSNGYKNSHQIIEDRIKAYNINLLVIALSNSDCSININFLKKVKEKYDLKLVFIFLSSQNSFEYIDRYYSQLADINIIEDIPYLKYFYDLLEIPYVKIDINYYAITTNNIEKIDFNISQIEEKNIFSSSLSLLSKKKYFNYYYQKYQSHSSFIYTTSYFKNIQNNNLLLAFENIFKYIEKKQIKKELIIDEKFKYSHNTYRVFWNIYCFVHNKKIECLKDIIGLDLLDRIIDTYRIYIKIKNREYKIKSSKSVINTISNILYRKYKI